MEKLEFDWDESIPGFKVFPAGNNTRGMRFGFGWDYDTTWLNPAEPPFKLEALNYKEFSDEELASVAEFLRAQPGIREIEQAYTRAYYAETLPSLEKLFPFHIFEAAEAAKKTATAVAE